jgi:transcription elongation factor Elf1
MSSYNSDVEVGEINSVKRQKLSESVEKRLNCDQCGKLFSMNSNLIRHKKNIHNIVAQEKKQGSLKCRICDEMFVHQHHRIRHEQNKHPIVPKPTTVNVVSASPTNVVTYTNPPTTSNYSQPSTSVTQYNTNQTPDTDKSCDVCGESYTASLKKNHEQGAFHKLKTNPNFYGDNIKTIQSAFKNRIMSFKILNTENLIIPEQFFNTIMSPTKSILHDTIQEHINVKFNTELVCLYTIPKAVEGDELPQTIEIYHITQMKALTQSSMIEDCLKKNAENTITKMGEFQTRGSGWSLTEIVSLDLNINKYTPLRGSSFIKLPPFITKRKAVINIQNSDEYCFAWAVNSALNPTSINPHRTSSYRHYNETLNIDGLDFPMKIEDIKKFEGLNTNISINVFGVEEKNIVGPFYYTENKKQTHINLLYLQDGESNHYCWIKNMSRYVN